MSRARRWLADAWERLLGPDPGQLRVVFALRLALMATITVLGLIGMSHWATMPIGAIGLGFMIAQFNAGAVRDASKRGQAITTVLVAISGLAGATLASLVARWPVGGDVALIALVFAATTMRAAGPRLTAAAMLAFIGFYLNLIIHVPLGQVPFEVAAGFYAACVALLVRLVILPERPWRALPRVLRSVRGQAARTLETVAELILTGGGGRRWRRRLTRHSARLEEAIEAAEDQIGQLGGKPADQGWNRLARSLVELQVHVQQIARLCDAPSGSPPPDPGLIARLAAATRDLNEPAPDRTARPAQRARPQIHSDRDAGLDDALRRLSRAIEGIPGNPDAIIAAARQPVSPEAPDTSETHDDEPAMSEPKPLPSRVFALIRQPVQVAVGTGAAIAAGHAVSGQRWYWSVLAVFIVFVGTSSRATTLTKAAQRVLGTLLGVGAGIPIAEAAHGDPTLIVALALLCDVFAFYAFQNAYSVMMFWITIMIALLYSLLGVFHPALMEIRFDETAVGAAAGIVVALLLLPRRTSEAMRDAGLTFLEAAGDALGTLPEGSAEAGKAGAARQVARAVQGLRAAAGPLGRGWVAVTPPGIRRTVHAAMASTYWMEELAVGVGDRGAEAVPFQLQPGLDRLRNALDQARIAIKDGRKPPAIQRPADPGDGSDPIIAVLCAFAAAADRFVRALDRATRRRHRPPPEG